MVAENAMSRKFDQPSEKDEESNNENVDEAKVDSVSDAEALECFTSGMLRITRIAGTSRDDVTKYPIALDLYKLAK